MSIPHQPGGRITLHKLPSTFDAYIAIETETCSSGHISTGKPYLRSCFAVIGQKDREKNIVGKSFSTMDG